MQHTHSELLQIMRANTLAVLLAGLVLITNSSSRLYAQVSGQGTSIVNYSVVTREMTLEAPSAHPAAFVLGMHPDLQGELFLGMLLVLLGCFFHALWVSRSHTLAAIHPTKTLGEHAFFQRFQRKMDRAL